MTEPKSEDESVSDSPTNEPAASATEAQESTSETQSGGSASPSQGKKVPRTAQQEEVAINQEEAATVSEGQAVESMVASPEDEVEGSAPTKAKFSLSGTKNLRVATLIGVLILGIVGFFLVSRGNTAVDLTKVQGNVALSEQELRDVVSSNHLTAYWAGPVDGDKYTIVATTPGLIYIKYLPGGVGANDTTTPFRTVGTYVWKSAFSVAQYTGSTPGHVGQINADGNALFYATNRKTNVYLGIKGKDIQVEVFDPVPGQALGLVLIRNQIRQIV